MKPEFITAYVLKTNPALDVRVLEEVNKLSQRLEQLGLTLASQYGLAPALGGALSRGLKPKRNTLEIQ